MRYYLGRRVAAFATAELALASVGLPPDGIRLVIDNSRINGSELIVVGLDKERGTAVVVSKGDDRGVTLWHALFGDKHFFDSKEEALDYADAVAKKLGTPNAFAVFEWAANQSMSTQQ